MDRTDKLIEQTQRLLARVADFQDALRQLELDLNRHVLVLGQHLEKLQGNATPPLHKLRPITTQERRTAPRRKGNPISVHLTDEARTGEPFEGWVLDRSAGGLRLLVDEAIEVGITLRVRPTKAQTSFPWVLIKVKSCQPERKSWNLGCQFLEKLTWEDLQLFG
jgi:hypothetical protein